MKQALTSICVIVLAGFMFSSTITLFQQAYHDYQTVMGHNKVKTSLVAYR